MTGRRTQLRSTRPPRGRWRVMLLLGLAVGLLATCGLGSVGAAGVQRSYGTTAQAGTAMGGDEHPCHGAGDPADHADAGCSPGAMSTAPVLPAPPPDPVGALPPSHSGHGIHAPVPDGGRAPPTLAELQLLRI